MDKVTRAELPDPTKFSMFNSPSSQQWLENKELKLKELWDQATQEVMMSYNNDSRTAKA